ncbi:MAG: DUF2148 domain-containing protein [Eubacterium sp.]|nr:DUF2148 domain-containing protein [Eubacterium sp.]
MIIDGKMAERDAVLQTAAQMCAAARTAPKTRGMDYIKTCIVTGEDREQLAAEMERLAAQLDYAFFTRDAGCVRKSEAVVLVGVTGARRGLNEGCGYCNNENCAACAAVDGICVYDPMDLGIALGSAVSVAADNRVDSRIMFSAGKAGLSLGFLGEDVSIVMGIPVSATGKSPYFDRG